MQLSQENAVLRHHLATVCQHTGQPFPPTLLTQPPAFPLARPSAVTAMHPGVAPLSTRKVASLSKSVGSYQKLYTPFVFASTKSDCEECLTKLYNTPFGHLFGS